MMKSDKHDNIKDFIKNQPIHEFAGLLWLQQLEKCSCRKQKPLSLREISKVTSECSAKFYINKMIFIKSRIVC